MSSDRASELATKVLVTRSFDSYLYGRLYLCLEEMYFVTRARVCVCVFGWLVGWFGWFGLVWFGLVWLVGWFGLVWLVGLLVSLVWFGLVGLGWVGLVRWLVGSLVGLVWLVGWLIGLVG